MVEFGFSTSTAPTDDDTGNGFISFPSSFASTEELPTEPEPNEKGFVLINGNIWLPKSLYEARWKQQRNAARKNENFVVWTK
ncbi:hypothetical protein LCGC14_1594540 [marine sediment metagenome]|uniref:Uncharacterized protein n=1 Tax=marine sediment metagenome TaxID=412755 RepID=A0A0F9ID11_9ZZZZ